MFGSKPTAKKFLSAASKGETSKIRRSLKVGLKLDITDETGRTPLHLACVSGNESAVILILGSGGDLLAKDHAGSTPLHLAGENGNSDVIEALFEAISPASMFISSITFLKKFLKHNYFFSIYLSKEHNILSRCQEKQELTIN